MHHASDTLLTFYDFPAEHWGRLRTSNPIESVFATVRHRTVRTKGGAGQEGSVGEADGRPAEVRCPKARLD